jgi:hypothetical protein
MENRHVDAQQVVKTLLAGHAAAIRTAIVPLLDATAWYTVSRSRSMLGCSLRTLHNAITGSVCFSNLLLPFMPPIICIGQQARHTRVYIKGFGFRV